MIEPLIEAVRREISGEAALESVRALSRLHRVQASPGYDEGAAWLVDRLYAAGFRPEIEHVSGDGRTRVLGQLMPQGWECRSAHAVLHDAGECRRVCDYEAEKLSLILRSAPAQGRFPLAALEDGTENSHYDGVEVQGRVVRSEERRVGKECRL